MLLTIHHIQLSLTYANGACSYPCITLPCLKHHCTKTHPLIGKKTYPDSQRQLQFHILSQNYHPLYALPANIPTFPTLAQFSSAVCWVIHVFP